MSKQDEARSIAAEYIIEQMQQGVIPWRRDWKQHSSTGAFGSLPYNYARGNTYHGSNVMMLMMAQAARGFQSNGWLTFNQAKALGGTVRKGEKSSKVVRVINVSDKQGNPILDESGRQKIALITSAVFNSEQCDGLPIREAKIPKPVEWSHEQAERLMKDSGVTYRYGGNAAYYTVAHDYVQLPTKEQFRTMEGFYATALHETGHASAHPTRLGRDLSGKFGSEKYAKEELIAECFSLIVADRLGLSVDQDYDPGNHIAYLQSWIKVLKNDHSLIFTAFAEAEKIATYYNVKEYTRKAFEMERDEDEVRPSSEESPKPTIQVVRRPQKTEMEVA
ncbi:TPA: ArdC family protein [Stenotrophomonas maltophilia]|nr:DUF1738 domain-containing protein [Stenotrophomonas maltophilia]HEL5350130.1 DUF1738 domain-containing protein [Stenotrophomonas maltophilia]HEL5589172.1 DUF1738 domain-containing protein [Stenotrophomonas maltophilia]HEL5627267.1 DUF1738 domain-containing protein [Stenotrophomonas maltophilia]